MKASCPAWSPYEQALKKKKNRIKKKCRKPWRLCNALSIMTSFSDFSRSNNIWVTDSTAKWWRNPIKPTLLMAWLETNKSWLRTHSLYLNYKQKKINYILFTFIYYTFYCISLIDSKPNSIFFIEYVVRNKNTILARSIVLEQRKITFFFFKST